MYKKTRTFEDMDKQVWCLFFCPVCGHLRLRWRRWFSELFPEARGRERETTRNQKGLWCSHQCSPSDKQSSIPGRWDCTLSAYSSLVNSGTWFTCSQMSWPHHVYDKWINWHPACVCKASSNWEESMVLFSQGSGVFTDIPWAPQSGFNLQKYQMLWCT